jgi:hypothetical protein
MIMAVRAIIIAVETYASMGSAGMANKLDGTLDDGKEFNNWLVQEKSVETADIDFLQNPTRLQISHAFRDLVDKGQNKTEELYVFYSGHGFSYTDTPRKGKPADFLVGSEFKDLRNSGDACLKLLEIQETLYQCLGPGTHYYFVDGCRNQVKTGDVNPATLGWTRDPSLLGQPDIFTLYSVERQSFAIVRSGFAQGVADGLRGRSRAKRRDGFEMWVSFESLRSYLENVRSQRVKAEPGDGPGKILQIDPIPQFVCTINVKNASATDQFVVTVQNGARAQIGTPQQFNGGQTTIKEPPDDYLVQVTHPLFTIIPSGPAKADLYDNCTLEFEKVGARPPGVAFSSAPPPADSVKVSLLTPSGTSVEVKDLDTGEVFPRGTSFERDLKTGAYQVRVMEKGWTTVRNERLWVQPDLDPSSFLNRVKEKVSAYPSLTEACKPVRALMGPTDLLTQVEGFAQAAIEKLERGQLPLKAELVSLEIVANVLDISSSELEWSKKSKGVAEELRTGKQLLVDLGETDHVIWGKTAQTISIGNRYSDPLRESLLTKIHGNHDSAKVDFSESLGPMVNQDLGLWLSIVGASRILGNEEFSKLAELPLVSFDDVKENDSPIYILIGTGDANNSIAIAIRQAGENGPPLENIQGVSGITGLYESRVNCNAGMHLVFIRIGKTVPFATATYCLPNRATLFTVARDDSGEIRVHQFMLPLAKLRQYLNADEQINQPGNFLDAIRFTTLAQKQLARKRTPRPPPESRLPDDSKLAADRAAWEDLLYGKWLDPTMAVMAAYELARNRNSPDAHLLDTAVANLRKYFSILPDVEIIAKLAGYPWAPPRGLPLFLTGLQAIGQPENLLPLPATKLDYVGPWITWLGVE